MEGKTEQQINEMLKELLSLKNISPDDMLINLQLGRIYKKQGDLKKAYKHADKIINYYPESAYGYTLWGDISTDDKKYAEAIRYYKKGLKCPEIWSPQSIHKKLALAYSKINKRKQAFKNMEKAVDVFSVTADYNDIWMLGNMAILSGNYEDGLMYLRFSMIKAPQTDKDFLKRVREQIKGLQH